MTHKKSCGVSMITEKFRINHKWFYDIDACEEYCIHCGKDKDDIKKLGGKK